MTPEHRQLVHDSWAIVAPAADGLAHGFYARLFEIDPSAAPLFSATDMPAQQRKFIDMLASIVRIIDEPDELVPSAAALARRHVEYGVEDRQYDSVGEALLWALDQTLGTAFTPATRVAWVEAYALVASLMRRAATPPTGRRSALS